MGKSRPKSLKTIMKLIEVGDVEKLRFRLKTIDKRSLSRNNLLLHKAVESGKINIVKIVACNKVSVNNTDDYIRTALHVACMSSKVSPDIVKYLVVTRKASVNCTDLNGDTPLHLACKAGSLEKVKLLLLHGAKVNERNDQKMHSLLLACESMSPGIMRYLYFVHNVNKFLLAGDNRTLVDVAEGTKNLETIECAKTIFNFNLENEANSIEDTDEKQLHMIQVLATKQLQSDEKIKQLGTIIDQLQERIQAIESSSTHAKRKSISLKKNTLKTRDSNITFQTDNSRAKKYLKPKMCKQMRIEDCALFHLQKQPNEPSYDKENVIGEMHNASEGIKLSGSQ